MKRLAPSILIATGLAAAAAGLAAPAYAAPGADTPDITISNYQNNGYKVILNRIGKAPLNECTITSTTPGMPITTPSTLGNHVEYQKVLYTTVYMTLDCTTPHKSGG
jgi:hypothetical protein